MADVEISAMSLMMAVQAVDAEHERLALQLDREGSRADPDGEELLLSYWKTAVELKKAYIRARERVSNLPPYEKLVKTDPSPPSPRSS